MSTQEFVLHPSGRMQVAIHGRIIAQASSSQNDEDLSGRSQAITIYESTTGEIIAAIEFRSEIEDELDFCHVERELNVSDISDLLSCQDPTEHIDQVVLQDKSSDKSDRLFKAAYQSYDLLGARIESQLRDFVPGGPPQPSGGGTAETKSVLSGWNPFGT